MTYTILFGIDFRHFEVKDIEVNEVRTITYQVGDATYSLTARLHEVSKEPTTEHTGTGFVNVIDPKTGYNEMLVCTIAKTL